ncbi:hydroxymethylglutaryl-CoA lyase [Paraburkholderia gardini]|uniref:hydroxymethylglutaryl-CoA lyase n=1 Tax=Paraburkholderia gardini TaxID=2823469 RepID=UPI001DE637B0|nr:hydroxymethylglutaryl-CoA lyase [Paraburkholderia gardini]CAG4913966.1 3-hydroxy-3-isohexenylglutaryl-CoA/hydroxy-methylglutaryl-CoA lyase [Paraburkholderia gardini]
MSDQQLPPNIKIVEVGPRDGLQNEVAFVPTSTKIELIRRLLNAGVTHIEAAAFVSPKWVPQMADGAQVLREIGRRDGVSFSALVPNLKGLDAALEAGCDEVAVFAAASETFSQRNINCSIVESIDRFAPVIEKARREGVRVRGYVSCVLGCPFEGEIDPLRVASVTAHLYRMGCYEISLGDTIGTGTPLKARRMIEACTKHVPVSALAGHFHDTWGMATANVYAALQSGVATFDSSVSGIGGCPYSPGATGNVATEDVVYLCHELGLHTGVDLSALMEAGEFISTSLMRSSSSRVARAMAARHARRVS